MKLDKEALVQLAFRYTVGGLEFDEDGLVRFAAEVLRINGVGGEAEILMAERDNLASAFDRLKASHDELAGALAYHQEQTRPIQRTIDALANAHTAPQPQQAAPGAVLEGELDEKLGGLLRETIDALDAARKRIAELDGKETDTWQYATGIVGMALYRAALSAAPKPARQMEGWQPIETAPKGRKLLLGYWNKVGNWRTVTGCYYPPHTLQMEDDRDDLDDDGYAPEGWYEESETQEAILPTDEHPTHWMPLPAAPSAPKPQHTNEPIIGKKPETQGERDA